MKPEEFIDIVRQNQKLIYKVCHIYAIDNEQRKDLEQEILLQLWVSIDQYKGNSRLSTWIYRVALNTAIGHVKKLTHYYSQRQQIDETVISLPSEESENASDNIRLLYSAIQQLAPIDRGIIMLYLDRLKQKEIADIMGISPSNVATKISRIKDRLSQAMKLNP